MSKNPILITCQPDDDFWIWQNHLYVESCIKNGFLEENINILLYVPKDREPNLKWDKLKEFYPKLNIHRYGDYKEGGVYNYLGLYVPVLRPHMLYQHFLKYPELEKEIIIYTDCDIIWTNKVDISKFYNDDICYMSNASGYMNSTYFDNKRRDILPEKQEVSKKRDFLDEISLLCGITKQTVLDNNDNIGGVQYILKGINANFWKKVQIDTLNIRLHLQRVNKEFYKNENSGIQSWCADLWSVIFNLWYQNKEVKIVPEMEFTWASDSIDKLQTTGIYHNAGITSELQGKTPVFYKGKYHLGFNPFNDPQLELVYNNEESKKLANWFYVSQLIELKNKYKINYY